MRVLLFAFDDSFPANRWVPHNQVENCVVYTGTHDNNTGRGWFEKEATQQHKQRLSAYTGKGITARNVHRIDANGNDVGGMADHHPCAGHSGQGGRSTNESCRYYKRKLALAFAAL